ncbi:MAG: tetratricopeptide repeat protein [Gammaproteobacteria bacterium]|nr:tetratricopeptide repeat protein [Gammaproteobacteria bacterium]
MRGQPHRLAARQGHAESGFDTRAAADEGRTRPGRDEALAWFEAAAAADHAEAAALAGQLLARGHAGVDPGSLARALGAAPARRRPGHPGAHLELGMLLEERDPVAARDWYRAAAERGIAAAQSRLGHLLHQGAPGIEPDPDRALMWFREAAKQGDARAQSWLGWAYDAGVGVRADPREALRWYTRAARRDDASAQVNLARLHESGRGTPRSMEQARYWYEQAAQQGELNAMTGLASAAGDDAPRGDAGRGAGALPGPGGGRAGGPGTRAAWSHWRRRWPSPANTLPPSGPSSQAPWGRSTRPGGSGSRPGGGAFGAQPGRPRRGVHGPGSRPIARDGPGAQDQRLERRRPGRADMQGYSRRTRRVLQVAGTLLEQQPEGIRPGDINARLRAEERAHGRLEVRGELSRLQRSGELALDPATGTVAGRDHRAAQRQRHRARSPEQPVRDQAQLLEDPVPLLAMLPPLFLGPDGGPGEARIATLLAGLRGLANALVVP